MLTRPHASIAATGGATAGPAIDAHLPRPTVIGRVRRSTLIALPTTSVLTRCPQAFASLSPEGLLRP